MVERLIAGRLHVGVTLTWLWWVGIGGVIEGFKPNAV